LGLWHAITVKSEYWRIRVKHTWLFTLVLLPACALILAGCQTGKVPERQQAIISLDRPVNRDPAAGRPFQDSGSIHAAQGNLQRSVVDFDEAIRLDPKFVQAYYSRGFVYNRLGQPLRAIEDFKRAILLDPDVAEGYLGRGEAHAALKQIPQAIENYREAQA